MKATHRAYAEELGDFNRFAHFLVVHNDHFRQHSTWCIGRFVDWKYGLYENKTAVPDFCGQNAQLWFDGFQELAGFAISENGDAGFALLTLPGYRFLFAEMLQWVAQWGDRGPQLSIEITEAQTLEAALLEHAGFRRKAIFYTQEFDLTQPLVARFPLAEDFTIVDMVHPS